MRREHCQNLLVAGTTTLVPIIFLTSEHLGCIVRFGEEVIEKFEIDEKCVSLKRGVNGLQYQLAFSFAVFAASATLARNDDYAIRKITSLVGLTRRQLCEIVILGCSALIGIFLYGSRQKGEKPPAFFLLGYYLIFVAWFAFFISITYTNVNRADFKHLADSSLEEKLSDLSGSTRHMFRLGKNIKEEEKREPGSVMSLNPGLM